ncbi:hypothetical protein [Streptomyces sp. URMC 123]|uniref:hypothetical protein n=1 Tax=Streptomyces sp. URMC 123 TaxID=3423403 RepID=UPI003F1B0ACD
MQEQARAVAALERAAHMEAAARHGSRWQARYFAAFAVGQLLLVPLALMWHSPLSGALFSAGAAVLAGGTGAYASRQRVQQAGFAALHLKVIGAWTAAYVLSIGLGVSVFADDPRFAAVATLACALPPGAAAWREARRTA